MAELLSLGNDARMADSVGPLTVRLMLVTGAYDATGGFSKAACGAVSARVAADVFALNTCQHVPAFGETGS